MKRRITYIQRPDAPFEAQQAVLTSKSLTIHNLEAAREDRLTFDLDDLPDEFRNVLQQSQELRLRWATERPFDAIEPFASRVSPGLHVQYTPLALTQSSEALCSLLRTAFEVNEDGLNGVNCTKAEETFITPPPQAAHAGAAASLQYHTELPSLKSFVEYIEQIFCDWLQERRKECSGTAESLLTADTVDLDYDSSSNTLVLSGLCSTAPEGGWSEEIKPPSSKSDKVEFGLLGAERGISADEIKIGGLLAVVGEDKKLKPTMFSFPSRHHALPESVKYSVSFAQPTGLHPTMSITIPHSSLHRPPAPDDTTCSLHTYLTLPSSVFGDQYQLGTTDPLFLQSHNLAGLRAHAGETDLEAPDWAVNRWGSTWLFELATPAENEFTTERSDWTATIPLHLRYLNPSDSGYRSAHVPWPVVFWACSAEDHEVGMGLNPFDRTNLGYDTLFGPRTFFYQLHPDADRLVETVDVPVLHLKEGEGYFHTRNIELATTIVISLGFFWILWRLLRVAWSSGVGANNTPNKTHDRQKKE
ncbi:Protein pbn1 [Penicillium malachiteum]|uniref:Protein PBN1 n=1 Tax=Penicillium malachiteum TaxID=1324776 RepID=A0AAD6HH08_9EURO|nr:Protein pbn1 [Penicillium malachiteum]